MEYVLVVDVGTSSLKAMLYNREGQLLHRAAQEYHSEFFGNHYVEQSVVTWKEALLATLKQSGEFLKAKSIRLDAVAVGSQRASVIPISDDGQPLHNAIMWQDKRSRTQCHPAAAKTIAQGYLSPDRTPYRSLFLRTENDVAAGRAS